MAKVRMGHVGCGFMAQKVHLPNLLTGTYVRADHNREFQFKAKVPNGKYLVYLAAGPILDATRTDPKFLLRVNDRTVHQDNPSWRDYDSEKYLHRTLWVQYSERPHALWLDFASRMFPVFTETVEVNDGLVTLTASEYFLSAMVLVPESWRVIRPDSEPSDRERQRQDPQEGVADSGKLEAVPSAGARRGCPSGERHPADGGGACLALV